jgi:hypothetical protein
MKEEKKVLVEGNFLLEKISGKGGWTYVALPEIKPAENTPFGWVTVSGTIDDYAFRQHKLMPMGNGRLFFSVNATVRKKIKKQAGAIVKLRVYLDEAPPELPEELKRCFEMEPPEVYQAFLKCSEGQQRNYIKWIYAARQESTKAERILKMMNELAE